MAKTLAQQNVPMQMAQRTWPTARAYLIGALCLFAILLAPFFSTIFLAAIFAFFFHPSLVWLKRHTGISKGRFLTVTFTFIMSLIVTVSVFGVSSIFDMSKANRELLMSINKVDIKIPDKLAIEIQKRFPGQAEQVANMSKDTLSSIKNFVLGATGDLFQSVPGFLMNLLVFFIALHFFLARSSSIRRRLIQMQVMPREQLRFLLRSAREAARETFISVLVIGLIQTLLVTIGAAAVGFDHVVVVFFVTFGLSLVPIIGAAPVAFIVGIYLFFQGQKVGGGVMVVVGIVTGSIDNILRSFFMSKSNEIPAGISFVCLIGGIIVFGFYGIFFGPFLGFLAAKFLTRRINDGTTVA